jgi:pimeloyl-ACP methyl ester carboxylesterase
VTTTYSFETLRDFTRNCLISTEAFFEPNPAVDYSFSDGVLTFSSGIKSETKENNLVRCRVFEHLPREKAVIILPHWNASPAAYDRFARIARWKGITALRMTLPYHDERRPSDMKIAEYMVSANLGRTIRSVRQAVLDARLAITWLEQKGYRKIGVVGSSLGSCVATIVAAHDLRVRAAVFLLMASDFGEVVWTGRATRHIRKALDNKITLEALKDVWSIISPITYVPQLRSRSVPVLIISGREDTVFKPYLTQQIVDAFRQNEVDCTWKVLPCGHYTLGTMPFGAYTVILSIRYLETRL